MPELEDERDAAEQVKREAKILVILGNPPYNAFAGVSPEEEQGLVEPYKEGLNTPPPQGGWGIKKFNLDDLYVRFFRLAERRIAEMTGKGVVSFISNHSWIAEPSIVVLRKHLLEISTVSGSRIFTETGKFRSMRPTGTQRNRLRDSGVFRRHTARRCNVLWVKTGKPRKEDKSAKVLFRDDINEAKAEERRSNCLPP